MKRARQSSPIYYQDQQDGQPTTPKTRQRVNETSPRRPISPIPNYNRIFQTPDLSSKSPKSRVRHQMNQSVQIGRLRGTRRRPIRRQRRQPAPNRPTTRARAAKRPVQGRTGRPADSAIQKDHKARTRLYNAVVDHYCKMQIYLKCMVPEDTPQLVDPVLQRHRLRFYHEVEREMRRDDFPSLQNRNQVFILHTGSPHGVFESWLRENCTHYSWQQVRMILLCWLESKSFSTEQVLEYLATYWDDIMSLVEQNRAHNFENVVKLQGRKGKNSNKDVMIEMREHLEKDHSILAYEIACYLVGCLQLFPDLRFT